MKKKNRERAAGKVEHLPTAFYCACFPADSEQGDGLPVYPIFTPLFTPKS